MERSYTEWMKTKTVFSHGQYIMGPEVQELEDKLASYVGIKHAIGCGSGTDALLLALMAQGVGPGDAVFTSPFTFVSSAEVIAFLGARPVFVDVHPETFNLNPNELEKILTKTEMNSARGIIVPDLFGLPAEYDAICDIARKRGLFVIEDAAQSFGAEYKNRKTCSLTQIGCTSFFPTKPLGCCGDGGMCFTDDDDLAGLIRSIREHGKGENKYESICVGINSRLDTIQASILLTKFENFPFELELRRQVAHRYVSLLSEYCDLVYQKIPQESASSYSQYSVLARNSHDRSVLQKKLRRAGIDTAVYYPKPLHLQKVFAYLGYHKGDFPITEDISSRIFTLPMYPRPSCKEQECIVSTLAGKDFPMETT